MNRQEYLERAHELAARGAQLPQTKLTPDQVRRCRCYSKTAKEWAEAFNVHVRTVEAVRAFVNHRHIA